MINHRQIAWRADLLFALALTATAMPGLVAGCARRADARESAVPPSGDAGSAAHHSTAPPSASGAPPFILDMDGMRREMQKARGHALFVHLWASWCGPCLGELPLVERFARAARARGATVLSVSLDNDWRGIARVPDVLRARAPSLTNFVARFDQPEEFMALFSRDWEGTIPALFAFDRAGKLSTTLIGEVEPSELDALLSRMPASAPGGAAAPSASSVRSPRPEQRPAPSGAHQ